MNKLFAKIKTQIQSLIADQLKKAVEIMTKKFKEEFKKFREGEFGKEKPAEEIPNPLPSTAGQGLEDIRMTLIKRAFLDTSYLTESEVDALLAKNYGEDWKVRYGIESQMQADERQTFPTKISLYTGKSLNQIDEEFFQKEKAEKKKK